MTKSNATQVAIDPWMDAKPSAAYINMNYRDYLDECNAGNIRHIKRGRKIISRQSWLDDYQLSFEQTGMLERR